MKRRILFAYLKEFTDMSDEALTFEEVGMPILGRIIQVPTAEKTAWLKKLNTYRGITASPVQSTWTKQKGMAKDGVTFLLVVVSVDYHRMGKIRSKHPYDVIHRIDRMIRRAGRSPSR